MALINPSNLYSGGNVVLDNTPYVRIALQQRAKRQALNDALYQHYSELPNKLNPAGVRVQDLDNEYGGINQTFEKIRGFWDENKEGIIKGGRERQAYLSLIQGGKQEIEQSKQIGKFELKSGQDFFTGKHKYRERDLKVKDAVSRPIQDPSHYKNPDIRQPYSFTDYSPYSAPYNSLKQQQFDKAVLGGIKPKENKNIQPEFNETTGMVKYTHTYDPQDIFNAASKAAEVVKSDPTIYDHYDDLMDNQSEVQKASEALSRLAGTEVVAETPEQMAAGLKAHELSSYSVPIERKDVAAEREYKEKAATLAFKRSLEKLGASDFYITRRLKLGDGLKRTYAKFKSSLDAGEQNKILDTFIDTMQSAGVKANHSTHQGQKFEGGTLVDVPKELVNKSYTINTGTEEKPVWEKPKKFFLSKDKQTIIPLYTTEEVKGKFKVDAGRSKPETIQNFKLSLGNFLLTKSKLGGEVTDEFTGDEDPKMTESIEMGTTEKTPGKPTKKVTDPNILKLLNQ